MITHSVIFAPLGQATRSEQVVDRLKNAIVTGLLEANEQLPNEAELSKLMGVSHITIREALNTLRNKNLIHTVRGRNGGSFVCELPKDQLRAEHPLREISSAFLADLGELHAAILSHSTKLACERSTPTIWKNWPNSSMSSRKRSRLKRAPKPTCAVCSRWRPMPNRHVWRIWSWRYKQNGHPWWR